MWVSKEEDEAKEENNMEWRTLEKGIACRLAINCEQEHLNILLLTHVN